MRARDHYLLLESQPVETGAGLEQYLLQQLRQGKLKVYLLLASCKPGRRFNTFWRAEMHNQLTTVEIFSAKLTASCCGVHHARTRSALGESRREWAITNQGIENLGKEKKNLAFWSKTHNKNRRSDCAAARSSRVDERMQTIHSCAACAQISLQKI